MLRTSVAPQQAAVASSRAPFGAVVTMGTGTTAQRTAAHGHWCAGSVSSMWSSVDNFSKKNTKRTARHLGSATT